MDVSDNLLRQFARSVKPKEQSKTEIVYGVLYVDDNQVTVELDGSSLRTPAYLLVGGKTGDRVMGTLDNRLLYVTGNLTSPAASNVQMEEYVNANSVTTDYLNANYANISLANIDVAKIDKAVINDLRTTLVDVETVRAATAEIGYLTADSAIIRDKLNANELEAEVAKLGYMEADFSNIKMADIDKANIGALFASMGLITDATIKDGHVTGFLDSVKINANSITAGTLIADRIIYRYTDDNGKEHYRLVGSIDDDGVIHTETLNGDIITEKTITADHIVAGTITSNELAASAITADKIASNAITTDKLAANSVTAAKINVNDLFAQNITATGSISGVTLTGAAGEFSQSFVADIYRGDNCKSRMAIDSDYVTAQIIGEEDSYKTTSALFVAPTYTQLIYYKNGNDSYVRVDESSTNVWGAKGVSVGSRNKISLDATNGVYVNGTNINNLFAAKSHTHSGYASSSHTHNYESTSFGVGGLRAMQGWADWYNGSTNRGSIYCNTPGDFHVRSNSGHLSLRAPNGNVQTVPRDNTILYGNATFVHCNYGLLVQNTNGSAWTAVAASAFNVGSSKLVKENISDMSYEDAKKILDLNVVSFDYKECWSGSKNNYGVIAEEVLDVGIESVVTIPEDYDESEFDESKGCNNKVLTIDYSKFVPYLIKMVQIQQKEITELKQLVTTEEL